MTFTPHRRPRAWKLYATAVLLTAAAGLVVDSSGVASVRHRALAQAGQRAWTAPVRIPTKGDVLGLQLAENTRGDTLIVWADRRGCLASSASATGHFGTAQTLSRGSGCRSIKASADPQGDAVIIGGTTQTVIGGSPLAIWVGGRLQRIQHPLPAVDAAVAPDGSVLILYPEDSGPNALQGPRLMVQRREANGTWDPPAVAMTLPLHWSLDESHISMDRDGNTEITWSQELNRASLYAVDSAPRARSLPNANLALRPQPPQLWARSMTGTGTLGPPVRITPAGTTIDYFSPDYNATFHLYAVAGSPSGRTTLVWTRQVAKKTDQVEGRVIQPNGSLQPVQVLSPTMPRRQTGSLSLVGLANGTAIAGWEQYSSLVEFHMREISPGGLGPARTAVSYGSIPESRGVEQAGQLVASGNRALVLWSESLCTSTPSSHVWSRLISAAGVPGTTQLILDNSQPPRISCPLLTASAASSSGNAAAAIHSESSGGPYYLTTRRVP